MRRNRPIPTLAVWIILVMSTPAAAADWGGHFRAQGGASLYEEGHVIELVDDGDLFFDGGADFRLKSTLALSDRLTLETHYEAGLSGGETRNAASKLADFTSGRRLSGPPSDDRRIFSLTNVYSERSDHVAWHRIDRLVATYSGDRATVRLGRQALSWGNGMIFNPMDLLNPFAPTDVIRDYKIGAEMALFQTFGDTITDFQLAWVPRRNPETGNVSGAESSFAAKMRFSAKSVEWDVMAARHYGETVFGAGASGYLWNAAWRTDVTWTRLEDDPGRKHYTSAVANLDYSWVWLGKNWYGLLELFHNGLGDDDAGAALSEPALADRLTRGELFTAGRWYLAGQTQCELHPLVNLYVTALLNLNDASALFQPHAVWDATESSRLLVGVDLPVGGTGSEFGGIVDDVTGKTLGSPVRGYFLVTWYF